MLSASWFFLLQGRPLLKKLQIMCQGVSQRSKAPSHVALPADTAAADEDDDEGEEEDPCRGVLAGSCTRLFRAALTGQHSRGQRESARQGDRELNSPELGCGKGP